MADQSKRGGQKKGQNAGAQSREHQGVRPDSTTQNKGQRQKQTEHTAKKSRVSGK